jgi:hypothetical protein
VSSRAGWKGKERRSADITDNTGERGRESERRVKKVNNEVIAGRKKRNEKDQKTPSPPSTLHLPQQRPTNTNF